MAKKGKKKRRSPFLRAAVVVLALLLAAGAVFWLTLPSVAGLVKETPGETAMMRFRAEQARQQGRKARRSWRRVPLSRMAPHLIQAVLIAEDDKFYAHEGFDWESMRKALEDNVRKGRVLRGGSTITQQLAKNLFLDPQQSVLRKLREAAIAWKLERALSKKRILDLYLNLIEWGEGVYGAEAAARAWFSLPAAELSLAQAIRLASILPNPRRFSALDERSPRLNRKRRLIAQRMLRRRWISQDAYDQALREMGLGS